MTWPSLAFCNLCPLTRRSIFTPRRHIMTAIEVSVVPNAPHGEHSREKGRHTENGSTETHQRPQKSQTQNPRMTPPRHDRPSSRLQTPIGMYITSKTNIHSSRSTGTPRHDGAVFLHCRAMRTSWTATSKNGQERQHQTGETAVARESTRMEHRAHRAHNTQNEPEAAMDTNALGPDLKHVVTTASHRNLMCASNAVRSGLPVDVDRTQGLYERAPTELGETRGTRKRSRRVQHSTQRWETLSTHDNQPRILPQRDCSQ